ncbi:hypothetical protein CRI70_28550 [Streptomyces sp. Ru87]|nr:hypothetical protein CRI70_28550 [Streptomyces sp. Ru87]
MRVSEARAVAARWAAAYTERTPGCAGAFVSGSAAWLPGDAELPVTSDVDVLLVTEEGARPARPAPGKFRREGVLIEGSDLPGEEIATPGRVLGSYYLAGSFRTDTVLADPSGRLAALRDAVAPEFTRRRWVRRRCAHAERRITGGLARLDVSAPPHDRVTGWLFPAGVTAHVLLTAGLRNPTVRRRYSAVRELLDGHGRPQLTEELLALLGCDGMSAVRVERHLRAMAEAFDEAARVAVTPYPFSSDITPRARAVAVDGSRALITSGHHREAVFWIAATYARCCRILAADAPPESAARHAAGFAELAADLGVGTPGALRARAGEVAAFLPRLREAAAEITAACPQVRD